MAKRVDLSDEAHTIVGELSEIRKEFREGSVKPSQARNIIGIYNVSCRSIDTTIKVERFIKLGK